MNQLRNRRISIVRLWIVVGLLLVAVSLTVMGREMAAVLGFSGPRSYLVIAQNEDELRATGGFVSAAGLLTLERGRIESIQFMDSYAVDDLSKDYPDPPEPLRTYMMADLWLFRDSNWSADFPTAARQMAAFFVYGQGKPVDGVVALDQSMVQLIVQALGGVEISGPNGTLLIKDDNLLDFMHAAWSNGSGNVPTWFPARKDFISSLAKAIQGRLAHASLVDWFALGEAVQRGVTERHLLVYLFDQTWSPLLAATGWDGAIRQTDGDYLMVVDSNVGFSKSNSLIQQSLIYSASIGSDLNVHSTLDILYQHMGQSNGQPCRQHLIDYLREVTYESMIDECLFDYLRVYTPAGAVLGDETHNPVPPAALMNGIGTSGRSEVRPGEAGKTVFAKLLVVAQAQRAGLTYRYDLGKSVVKSLVPGTWQYSLYWQKQPGTHSARASVIVSLPAAARMVNSSPDPSSTQKDGAGTRATFNLDLDSDQFVTLAFRY